MNRPRPMPPRDRGSPAKGSVGPEVMIAPKRSPQLVSIARSTVSPATAFGPRPMVKGARPRWHSPTARLRNRACYGHLGSLSSGARAVDDGIALAETSFAASRPSINGEQPKSGMPSRRKVRSSSMPRESANVNPCRLRHTRLDALAVATICRVSPTHAPINFPSRPIDTSVICAGWVMRNNSCTSGCL
jgi:hypothetical protein